ncbi:MAG: GNAT family N-acetyltransferase [Clostridia bacterium]|nr:GNAT family N-acetyltransferase [Clostridia bacterium]
MTVAQRTRQRVALPPPAPVILRDGTTAWLRPARPDDVEKLNVLFSQASRESLWLRFFTPAVSIDRRYLERMADVDGVERMTYVVTRGEGEAEQVLAVGSYVRHPRWDTAEVAFFVADAHQGKGLGTLLLERIAEHARQQGILTLVADVLPENHRMLDVFRKSGFEPHVEWDRGVVRVELPATPGEVALARSEARERTATAASLAPFFRPRSVAVIGASRDRRSVGRMVLEKLLQTGFEGPVYPVNPHARAVASVRAYPSVLDVPDDVDLAVVAVPAERVPEVVDACARKRVRALVVLSAGFAEIGPEGRARQDDLVRKVRAHGMRLIGPNCMGILNTDPAVRLNATFSPVFPPRGRVAMSSQSGALGLAILDYAEQLGLGISMFVSVGNKADVSGNDLLQFWEEDPDTDLIILYLESFGNPRKFARIARRIARRKPILAVKSGRTAAGSRAARSHTAALAGSDRAVDALFHQAGVIRADTLEELFDVAAVLANQPLPAGNRVGIVTNAGGPGILCADACEANGLVLPSLAPETVDYLRRLLPPAASLANPVDMIASAPPEHYEGAVRQVLRDPNVDALIVIFIPTGAAEGNEVARAIRRAVASVYEETGAEKPVLACFMSSHGLPAALGGNGAAEAPSGTATRERVAAQQETPPQRGATRPIPSFRFPESAARALAQAVRYADWRRRPPGQVPVLRGVDAGAARAVVEEALRARGEGWLRPEEAARLLAAAGIELPAFAVAATAEEAAAAAARIGFPVAVKAVAPGLTHKTDVGGVALHLSSAAAVRQACEDMRRRIGNLEGFLVQQMADDGTEVIVGVVDDPTFGPLIGFGLGGTAVEVLNDTAFRITPLTDADAREMVRSIRAFPLLQGYRGRPPADLEALEDLLLRVSWLVEEVPEIAEMDLNPVRVFGPGRGLAPVDVRVYVRP